MASARRISEGVAVLVAVAAIALIAIPAALAAFGAQNPERRRHRHRGRPTSRRPRSPPTAIAKTPGGVTGFVQQGGTYFVYANVAADTGNPASGLATVKANVEEVTTGQTAVR